MSDLADLPAVGTLEMLRLRRGVWARQLLEFVDDLYGCGPEDGDHEYCLLSRVAARWPEPNVGQDVED
jgi:hypothetical protein